MTDPAVSPTELERLAASVTDEAAGLVRAAFGRARATRTKSTPTDVVTETDLQAEQLIRKELAARWPGSAIVGEEYADQAGSNGVGWIVDPIDGTVNFLYDLPVVSVSIAATYNGDVVAGAVTDILRGETFSAALGAGARSNGSPMTASRATDLGMALVATGFSYHAQRRALQAEAVQRILPAARDIRCFGSAALNLCWVGCGRVDAYFERGLEVYDFAAGALIAAEAGAAVEIPSGDDDLVIASSPDLLGSLRQLVLGDR